MEPKVAVYLRVSTESQSHDSQEAELKEYCTRRGWQNVEWYRDIASGTKRDREGLAAMMQKVRRGKLDIIVAFKLDRMARSLSHLAQIIAELQAHRVALICPSQGIDTSNGNPAANLQLNILGAVAEFERQLCVERVRAGIAAARQRGVKLGRPGASQHRRSQVTSLLAEGLTAKEISRRLNVPYSSTTELLREIKEEERLRSSRPEGTVNNHLVTLELVVHG